MTYESIDSMTSSDLKNKLDNCVSCSIKNGKYELDLLSSDKLTYLLPYLLSDSQRELLNDSDTDILKILADSFTSIKACGVLEKKSEFYSINIRYFEVLRAPETDAVKIFISASTHNSLANKSVKFKDKKEKLSLKIIDKNDIKNCNIIGYVGKKSTDSQSKSILRFRFDEDNTLTLGVSEKSHITSKIIGYIKISEDSYIAVTSLRLIPLLILPVLVIGVPFLTFGSPDILKPPTDPVKIVGVSELPTGKPEEVVQESIDFVGFPTQNLKDKEGYDYVPLSNPEQNDVYFAYEVLDENNNSILKTDLIEPGKTYLWYAKKDLGSGTKIVKFHVFTYDMDTLIPNTSTYINDIMLNIE